MIDDIKLAEWQKICDDLIAEIKRARRAARDLAKPRRRTRRFRITSGDLNCVIASADGEQAAVTALKTKRWRALGVLLSIRDIDGEDPILFWDSKAALRRCAIIKDP